MKKTVKILRIIVAVIIAVFTLMLCQLTGTMVYRHCTTMAVYDTGFEIVFDRITADAVFYFVCGIIMLLLGVVSIVFLFLKKRIFGVVGGGVALILAVFGVCLNTGYAEMVTFRALTDFIGIYGLRSSEIRLNIKLASLSVLAFIAVGYTIIYIIALYKDRKNNDCIECKNEQ